jgi:hypothetical protein
MEQFSVLANPCFSSGGEMIAQKFDFTADFLKEWNNLVYFRLKKICCGIKDQVRARHPDEKYGFKLLTFYGVFK